jgi:cytochrome c oxidase cbb3-type subunit III
MKTFRTTLFAALALTACFLGAEPALAAETAGHVDHANSPAKISEMTPEEIFRKSCAVCHGERGNGNGRASINLDPKPRDFTQSPNLTRDMMIDAVTHGRPGTAMMPWTRKYSAKQLEGVVDYIRGRFMLVALDPKIETGRAVYGHFCQVCHGDRGQGVTNAPGGNPRDWTVPANQGTLTKDRMISVITKGQHGSTVPAGFGEKLSAEHIAGSVAYIRRVLLPNLAERDHDPIEIPTGAPGAGANVPAPPPAAAPAPVAPAPKAAPVQPLAPQAANTGRAAVDMSLPMPRGLKPDIKAGERFFLGNCSTCHGKLGNGEGPRAYFLNPRPRNFHDEYSHTFLNRPALFAVITTGKPGTVMPAWGKVLSDQEIANVAEFVFETFIQGKGEAKAAGK